MAPVTKRRLRSRTSGLVGPPPFTGFSDPVLSTVCPYPFLRPAAHISPTASLPFAPSPFAARSGGSANPVGLLSRGQRPDYPCRPVGERHRDQHLRLTCQHPGQPRIRDLAAPARVLDDRHGSRDQEASQVSLSHLRYPAQPRLAARGVLSRHEADPGREVAPVPEALHRRREGLEGQRGDRSDSRDRHQPRRLFVLARARPELPVESVDLVIELPDPPEEQPAQLDDRLRQAHSSRPRASRPAAGSGPCPAEQRRRTRRGDPGAH